MAKKNKSSLQKDFDKRASNYGAWFKKSLGTKHVDRVEKEAVLKILKSLGGQKIKIAELGIGKGRLAKYLLKNMTVEKYFGIDISPKMTQGLRKMKKMKIIIADASKAKFKEKVDVVLSIRQIKYNQRFLKQLTNSRRQLKSKGLLVIEFPSLFSVSFLRGLFLKNRAVLFNPFKLKKQLKRLGFKNISMDALQFLPDNIYEVVNNSFNLKLLRTLKNLLKKTLPCLLGKSIILTARLD